MTLACWDLGLANPVGPQVAAGSASFQSGPQTLTVTNAPGTIINWQGFSIGAGELTRFQQQSAASAVLNRVAAGNPSSILGTLSSNGRVFLVNPSGIVFGAGSVIDTAGFIASTLNITDRDFLQGKLRFEGGGQGALRNAGTIRASGDIFMVGPTIENTGAIRSDGGSVVLAAGKSVTISSPDAHGVTFTLQAPTDSAVNLGTIEATNAVGLFAGTLRHSGDIQVVGAGVDGAGHVVLAAQKDVTLDSTATITANGAAGGHVQISAATGLANLSGTVEAIGAQGAGGRIDVAAPIVIQTGGLHADGASGGAVAFQARHILQAGAATADGRAGAGGAVSITADNIIQTVTTRLSANGEGAAGGVVNVAAGPLSQQGIFSSGEMSATGAGAAGGRITVTGNEIVLRAARLDASGDTGGGTVLIGGDWQGKSAGAPNAQKTQVNFSTTIRADARESGDGGTVVVWSDNKTQFGGTISARGGALSGDGGRVEVSGKETLVFGGIVDAAAPNGKAGTLLLDPGGILIDAAGGGQSAFDLFDPTITANDSFGTQTAVLPNGNIVVLEPLDDIGGTDAGAVYLFNGSTGALMSTLTGSSTNDLVGFSGVTVLTNGNFVVGSLAWSDNGITQVGAATWINGTMGLSGAVGPGNSLTGTTQDDLVGRTVTALTNGNYVVQSPDWNNAAVTAMTAGAVTFGNGSTGTVGRVSAMNSLVGTTLNDQVGLNGVTPLANGNYVVVSSRWQNAPGSLAGAVTFGNGTSGVSGNVAAGNSLVGSTNGDTIGSAGVIALPSSNYVVGSPFWNNGGGVPLAGAATFGNATGGTVGPVTATNSLVGTTTNDQVGESVALLKNGNYVVVSRNWNAPGAGQAGAVTWGSGTAGVFGPVDATNSLVGSTLSDFVGFNGVTPLTNGNYVVSSPDWDGLRGAATFGSGTGGTVGPVTAGNSLVGNFANDRIGSGTIAPLANGNYVVASPAWATGPSAGDANAGAVTWGNGTGGTVGPVTAGNSLVGSPGDQVGSGGVFVLTNGNYVVSSPDWVNGGVIQAGAATWGSGTGGLIGAVGVGNSLVGSSPNDLVSNDGVTALTNGNYVVGSPLWDGTATDAGAATWGNGTVGITGEVTAGNSLVGSTASDNVGARFRIIALTNGNYVVAPQNWDNAGIVDAGAVTFGNGTIGVSGTISAMNSLVGVTPGDAVGGSGVTVLQNGNYVVASPSWDNGGLASVGAVTWGNGRTGTLGTISAMNSLIGSSAGDFVGNHPVVPIGGGNRVLVGSPDFNNGAIDTGRLQIYDGSGGTFNNPLTFNEDASGMATITPAAIIAITNAGTAVTLQANTDITLAAGSNIVTSAAGAGGSLTMQAGRSIFLNSNIVTDNGNLTLVANETLANGVRTAHRDPGAAVISMAAGTSFNAGTGLLSMTIANGAGRTGMQALGGDITSGAGVNLTGGRISLLNNGGGGIVLGTGAFQSTETGLPVNMAAITMVALGAGASISSNANLTTVSGAVNVSANDFIELDPGSVGTVINAAGNASIFSNTSSISAFGVDRTTAFMDVTGAAVSLTAATFVNLGEVAGHGLRARTGDVTVSAGTSIGGFAAGSMRGPIVSDTGNVNLRLLGLGAAGTSFFDMGDRISAPNGSITIDNGSGGRINSSISLTGASPITAGSNVIFRATNFLNLATSVTAGGTVTLDTGSNLVVAAGAAAGAGAGAALNIAAANASFTGGTTTITGSYNVPGTTAIAGAGTTVNFNATAPTLGALVLTNGTLGGTGAMSASSFNFTGGTLAHTGGVTITGTTINHGGIATLTGTLATGVLDMLSARLDIGASGVFSLNGTGMSMINGGMLVNAGTVNQAGASRLTLQGTAIVDNNGIWNLSTSAASPLAGVGRFNNAIAFNNDGTTARTLTADFNNTGLLRINAGSLTLQVAGAANNPGVIDIAADAALAVSGTSVTNDGFVFLGARALLTTSGGPVTNNNTTILAADARLTTSGQPVTNTGVLSLGAGAVLATGGANVTNTSTGILRGTGTVSLAGGMLVNNGMLTPGASPGTMMVDGNFTQGASGILAIDVAGPNPSMDYDVLRVTGAANLAGALHIIQSGGYVPPDGQTFDFLAYASRTGDFQTFVFPPGFTLRATPGPTGYGVAAGPAAAAGGNAMGAAMMSELTATSSNQVLVLNNTSSERATESESNNESTATTSTQAVSEQKPRTAAKDCR